MSLPQLLKYVYNNGTDEVIRRGKRIFATGGVELLEADPILKSATFRVKSDTHANYYRVSINKYHETGNMSVRCQCPYNLGDICRHEAAAMFQLQEMLDKNHFESYDTQYNQQHTLVKMKFIDQKSLKLLTSTEIFAEAEKISKSAKNFKITAAKDEKVEATLKYEGQEYPLIIQRNEERFFDTHCTCDETEHAVCKHKTALFLHLLNSQGPYYFDTLRNWDKEKNKLLSLYGYSLDDNLEGKFTFSYMEGKPFLRVLDPSIKRVDGALASRQPVPPPPPEVAAAITQRIGVVFNANEQLYPFFRIDLVSGEVNEEQSAFVSLVNKLDLSKYIDFYQYKEADRDLITPVRKVQGMEVSKFLSKNSPFAGIWENITHDDNESALPTETKELMLEYLHPKLAKLFPQIAAHGLLFLLPNRQQFKTKNLQPVHLAGDRLQPIFKTHASADVIEVTCHVLIEGEMVNVSDNEWDSSILFLKNNVLYLFENAQDALHVELFRENGRIRIPAGQWGTYLQDYLLPLSKQYQIQFDNSLLAEVDDILPECRVFLREVGETFIIQPGFAYHGQEVDWNDDGRITVQEGNKVLIIHRNKEAEQQFVDKLSTLHTNFFQPNTNNYFFLKAKEALKNNWFFLFFDTLKEMNVRVFGFENLKNFKFSAHKPVTNLQISSGIDWFDAQIEVTYGDQKVSIRDIKQALAGKQNYVQLADGSLGLLPEEWLKKYSLLFKIGEEKDKGALKLSKYNFSVIDELFEFIDDDAILLELEQKRRKLLQFDEIRNIALPHNLRATLRPYQESGFQWLNYLDEVKWGGILADDMGLGKTIQALTFIQHYKNKHDGKCLALVVCPTTLIYNWENEIKKFTPSMTYHIHHGPTRLKTVEELLKFDILITTYGTLRSDVQTLMKMDLDYVVLDESQAIKNPQSKVTKAAQLLNTKNKLALSGTPMQNNTFDIYAQMNFLNPGMLGSVDFFRNEFATPIDKFQDEERKDHLRKLIYPFILRRTKEQVAKELPEKIETVIFCEMDAEQRHIYDAYRNSYRSKILGVIEDQGMERSQLTILQGLMKLRQICDSPAILNEAEQYPNHSVKLHELTREMSENISNHKVLIFSQFLGMLGLIREKLQHMKIPFEYFDGSTSATERERAIQNFQSNDDCRVFLISLKAGGVGLNLTAADYVYIVDPWWNPAVEQQAIDRTHRIGQTKNIFAYRMICKDTVEEKILQLQERKKSLVKEIIADDSGFVKKLTKEDVLYLFS
ncbi:DEAD/DEAH box helicase [Chitinophaga sp. CF418]|uniref:DEAD/DEAH box helicase n=1 Tax=Chitinophaga sp. CF418 TaxID=1855287 RepID=UPI0009122A6A|nr:DEAD/DEAH box helicase [Chitinophaga sp. CF418]SHM52029.1 non-specific serine/threonine protein kinase [Chitinophaga sp. CF418]